MIYGLRLLASPPPEMQRARHHALVHLLLAEDAALVALLAEGRFILGLGAGYRDDEFDALGVPRSQRSARLAEAVEVCRKAWLGEPFDHDGPSVRGSGLVCRPAPPTPPRIWLGGRAPAALARAARLADGFVAGLAGPRESAAVIAELDAVMPRGQPALPICTGAFVAVGSDRVMLDGLAAGIVHAVTQYRSWLTVEPELYSTATDETFGVVRGRPHEVIEQLLPRVIAHAGREHHLALRVDYPGLSKDQIADHIRLVASEIAPALRRAEASAAAG